MRLYGRIILILTTIDARFEQQLSFIVDVEMMKIRNAFVVLRVTLSYNNGSLNKRFSSHTKRGKIGFASANRCRDEVDVVA